MLKRVNYLDSLFDNFLIISSDTDIALSSHVLRLGWVERRWGGSSSNVSSSAFAFRTRFTIFQTPQSFELSVTLCAFLVFFWPCKS